MPIDTTQWKTFSFGRFNIRAPQDAVSYGSYSLWTDSIEHRKDLTSMDLLRQEVAGKQAEFKSQKHVNFGTRYINTFDLKGRGISVWGYEFEDINELNDLHYATVYTYYFSNSPFRVWAVKRTLPLQDGEKQKELDYETKLAQCIRPLEEGEVPKDYGFVIDGGMVASDEYRGEGMESGYWTPALMHGDVHIGNIEVSTTATARASDTTLFQRLDKEHATLMAFLSRGKELRKRELVLNGIAGQEYLYRTAPHRSDWMEYHFEWTSNGKVEDNYHPDISVRFDMRTIHDKVLPPPPFQSDEEAMAFWDAALGTLQLRPVTASDGRQVASSGEVIAPLTCGSEQRVPRTGVYRGCLDPSHPDASYHNNRNALVFKQEGQTMDRLGAYGAEHLVTWTWIRAAREG